MTRILIIDDSYYARDILKKNLKKIGITNIEEAKNAKIAINKFKSMKFDLVILDLKLPDVDGTKVLKKIKKTKKQIPVIVVTAIGQESEKKECKKLGADEYIIKPFERKKLLKSIKKNMKKTKS